MKIELKTKLSTDAVLIVQYHPRAGEWVKGSKVEKAGKQIQSDRCLSCELLRQARSDTVIDNYPLVSHPAVVASSCLPTGNLAGLGCLLVGKPSTEGSSLHWVIVPAIACWLSHDTLVKAPGNLLDSRHMPLPRFAFKTLDPYCHSEKKKKHGSQ